MSAATAETRWFSLRRRLLGWLLTGITVGWLGTIGYSYVEARHEILELFEERSDEPMNVRHLDKELAEHLIETLLMPLLISLPLLAAWIWFATRRGLAPLDAVAAEVGQRAPERLEPLAPATAPREIRPLLGALNDLFARMARTLDSERRFTADAAHELRTPLAALAMQAQVAMRARDAAERDHALRQILAGSQRAGRLVEQLLILARLDPAAGFSGNEVDLAGLASEICAAHGAAVLEKDIALELEAPAPCPLRGNADMLRVLLRNLVDNAVRYTPRGGRIRIGVAARGGRPVLEVSDSGPGIPAAEHANVLRRFHRLAGQEVEGSGLGLSIVARIAELHGARLELGEGLAAAGRLGLTVRVIF